MRLTGAAMAAALLSLRVSGAGATDFWVTNLVTDDQGAHAAQITDTDLVDPWGLSTSPTSGFWVSANGTGVVTIYDVDPDTHATTKQALTVTILGDGSVTGQVFNGSSGQFNGDAYLFSSEDGTISGWRPALGATAEVLVTPLSNRYTGAAIGVIAGNAYLYAANFTTVGVDVFKGNPLAPSILGSFADPILPAGYSRFNVQNLGGTLYVTFAKSDAGIEMPGPGLGIVDAFDLQGNFQARVATGGVLNAPWGLAIAPASFGEFAGDLLVGNFGDGTIHAYDPATHALTGTLMAPGPTPLVIDGLRGLLPGNGMNGGDPDRVYFAAGPDSGAHGVFGAIVPLPEPDGLVPLCAGFAWLGWRSRAVGRRPARRRRSRGARLLPGPPHDRADDRLDAAEKS